MYSNLKILLFTFTRAEFGLQKFTILALNKEFACKVVVGGMHLLQMFGNTYREVISELSNPKIEMEELDFAEGNLTERAITNGIGKGLIGVSSILERAHPDYVVVFGDRWEAYIPSIASVIFRVPMIHFMAGEVLEDVNAETIDRQVRFAVSSMAHVFLASTETYAEVISKTGEEDWRIYVVGAPGLENIKRMKLYSIDEIKSLKGVDMSKPTILCTHHPSTLENEESVVSQVRNTLKALSKFDVQIVFTAPNAEVGSEKIMNFLRAYVRQNSNKAFYFESLGTKLYLSMMAYSKAIAGNSSSGIIEAPSFQTPTVNIGNRQKGRFQPASVIQTGYSISEITTALEKALHDNEFLEEIKYIKNPYGDGNTSKYVVEVIKEIVKIPKERLLKKKLRFEVKRDEWHRYF